MEHILNIEQCLIQAHNADTHEDSYNGLRRAVGNVFECIKVQQVINEGNQSRGYHSGKPLSEFKSFQNLKALGSDKEQFRVWNDRFQGALSQARGAAARHYLTALCGDMDVNRKEVENYRQKAFDMGIPNIDDMSEEVFHILQEKTEGEAELRV